MKNKKIKIMFAILLLMIIFFIIFLCYAFKQRKIIKENYATGKYLLETENFEEAIKYFDKLKEYKDASNLLIQAQQGNIYIKASKLLDKQDYTNAIKEFEKLENYKDSKEKIKQAKYELAIKFYKDESYNEAKLLFLELGDYEKSEYYLAKINIAQNDESQKTIYDEAYKQYENEQYKEALEGFNSIIDYKDSKDKAKECKNQIKRRDLNNTVSGGIRHTAAIFDNGEAIAVGDEDDDRCNLNRFKNMISIDAGGCLTIGLQKNGKVMAAGTYDGNKKIDTSKKKWNKEKFIDIAAGERFVVGLTENGNIVADGHKDDGQINFKDWEKEKIIAIDAGWRFTVGLTENKELKFSGLYGDQLKDFLNHKEEWKDVVNISAAGGDTTNKKRGSGHTVGLKSDGTVVAVGGDDKWKQCDVYGKEWKNIIKVVAGDWYTVGLKANGQVLITGKNQSGTKYKDYKILKEINKKKDIVDIAAGYGQTILLHKNGTVSAFGFDEEGKYTKTLNWENLKISN